MTDNYAALSQAPSADLSPNTDQPAGGPAGPGPYRARQRQQQAQQNAVVNVTQPAYQLPYDRGPSVNEQSQRAGYDVGAWNGMSPAQRQPYYNGGGAPTPLGASPAVNTPPGTTPAVGQSVATATAPPVDRSAWHLDNYAAPAYTAGSYGNAPAGWDQTKWADPNHQTPKYVVGRIMAEAGPQNIEANRQTTIANIQKAYPGAQFNGKDKISIDGGKSWVDIWGGAGAGLYTPAWMPEDAGGPTAAGGGAPPPWVAPFQGLQGAGGGTLGNTYGGSALSYLGNQLGVGDQGPQGANYTAQILQQLAAQLGLSNVLGGR